MMVTTAAGSGATSQFVFVGRANYAFAAAAGGGATSRFVFVGRASYAFAVPAGGATSRFVFAGRARFVTAMAAARKTGYEARDQIHLDAHNEKGFCTRSR
ncbi:hypothetical protein NL676_000991 [Syzygium grande]|nr:hypothetical protein NL676_000991 [Syzygium grande]